MNDPGVPPTTPRTASITVNWGSPKDTVDALHSLAAMTMPPDLLICVDNGSSPEELSELRAKSPPMTIVIEMGYNAGVAAANNAGMERAVTAGAEWVLFLNNDALVEPECLSRCLAHAQSRDRPAILGPAVVFAGNRDMIWYAGGVASTLWAFPRHRRLRANIKRLPRSSRTDYVPTCCALLSVKAWRDLGPFRADFFMYYDDTEWCLRARQHGWQCFYLGQVLAAHSVSASSGRVGSLALTENMAYYLARNPLRFALESEELSLRLLRVMGVIGVYGSFNAWRVLRSRDPRVVRAYLQGLMDATQGRMGIRQSLRQD